MVYENEIKKNYSPAHKGIMHTQMCVDKKIIIVISIRVENIKRKPNGIYFIAFKCVFN